MPANLSIRNVDDDVVASLRRRAARHGRSTEAEVREILRRAAADDRGSEFEALAAEFRASLAGRSFTPAEDLVRESRDER
jgi:antitoxin FitA